MLKLIENQAFGSQVIFLTKENRAWQHSSSTQNFKQERTESNIAYKLKIGGGWAGMHWRLHTLGYMNITPD